jgi:hypothetical protein
LKSLPVSHGCQREGCCAWISAQGFWQQEVAYVYCGTSFVSMPWIRAMAGATASVMSRESDELSRGMVFDETVYVQRRTGYSGDVVRQWNVRRSFGIQVDHLNLSFNQMTVMSRAEFSEQASVQSSRAVSRLLLQSINRMSLRTAIDIELPQAAVATIYALLRVLRISDSASTESGHVRHLLTGYL